MGRVAGPYVQMPCHTCGAMIERPLHMVNRGSRRRAFCTRECYYAALRIQPEEARKRQQARTRAWKELNADRVRRYRRDQGLRASYGITLAEYDEMVEQQAGKCAICKTTPTRSLSVDHCHTTGVIRGLLCHSCNQGLGHFRDDPTLLDRAKEYLT